MEIDSVTYTAPNYNNGALSQQLNICKSAPYTRGWEVCQIVSGQNGTVPIMAKRRLEPGVQFYIEHIITGGKYPVAATLTPDTLTINYHYFK